MNRASRIRTLLAALALTAANAAGAAPARYLCGDDSMIDIDFTPAQAQLRLGAAQWELDRVRVAGAALFRNRKQGVSLRVEKSDATLIQAGTTRRCRLERPRP